MPNLRTLYFDSKRERMLQKNQNWIAVVVGAVGSGKTYSAITIADELMYGKLDPKVHIVFSIEDFMYRLNRGLFKPGDVVVFEEAGVNISSKDWQSKANRNINFVLQTCRHMNFSIIFTLPVFKFLDSSTRALIHSAFKTEFIDYDKNLCYLRVYDIILNPMRDTDPKTVFPKYWVDGALVTMKRIVTKLPRKELIDYYETQKQKFTSSLNQEIEKELRSEAIARQKKMETSASCPDCGGNAWRFYPSRKGWTCRRCGAFSKKNPFNGEKL